MFEYITKIAAFLEGEAEWLLFVLVFLATVLLVYALLSWIAGGRDPVQRRLDEIAKGHAAADKEPHREGSFDVKWARPVVDLILPADDWKKSRMRMKLVQAGYRGESALHNFVASKVILALLIPVIVVVPMMVTGVIPLGERMTGVIALLLSALIGYYLPDGFIAQKKSERQLEFVEGFPDAMDMLVVCVEAGLGLDAAIQRVGKEIIYSHKELASEFSLVSLELRAGKTRQEALKALGDRTGVEQVQSLAAILIQAEHFGTSVASALREHAEEMRTMRIQRAKERAAKLPVKMLFPIMFFIFPALFLVVLGPAVVSIFKFFLGN